MTEPTDPDTPVVTGLKTKDGWRYAPGGLMVRGRREVVLVAPDGTEYLIAGRAERADLVVDLSAARLPDLRLRLLQGSGRAKAARRETRAIERRTAARNPRKKVRRK